MRIYTALICCTVWLAACSRSQPPAPQASSSAPTTLASPSPMTSATHATAPSASQSAAASGAQSASLAPSASDTAALVARRPYHLRTPAHYDASKLSALVIFLHGYGASASTIEQYVKFGPVADSKQLLTITADGTADSKATRFWNATDACCNFDHSNVDDVAYLRAVMADASARHRVDPKRIFVVGYSNGGFMAHRVACELSDQVAAIVSVAGATWADESLCTPTGHVSVLQVHGDADPTINYGGGHPLGRADTPLQPGARKTVAFWAKRNGCGPNTSPTGLVDLEDGLDGPETTVERYSGCSQGAVELHITYDEEFGGEKAIEAFVGFLLAHPKP